jgi:ribosomal protein L22
MSADEETTGQAPAEPGAGGEPAAKKPAAKKAAKPPAEKQAAAEKEPAGGKAPAAEEKPPAAKKASEKKAPAKAAAKKAAAKKPAAKKPAAKKEPVAEQEPDAKGAAEAAGAGEKPAKGRAAKKPAAKDDVKAAPEPKAAPAKPGAKDVRRRKVVRAKARYVRTSARKARMVCGHLRGKSIGEARAILAFTPREVARDWSKLLESAVANAEANHELLEDDLIVREAYADEGPTIKRFRPRAMGRATPIRKRTSHLSIALTPRPQSGTNNRQG